MIYVFHHSQTVRSKAQVCGRSLAGTAGSKPAAGMAVSFFFKKKKIYCSENQRDTQGYKITKIVPLTNLPELSLAGRVMVKVPYQSLRNIAVKNKYKGKTLQLAVSLVCVFHRGLCDGPIPALQGFKSASLSATSEITSKKKKNKQNLLFKKNCKIYQ